MNVFILKSPSSF